MQTSMHKRLTWNQEWPLPFESAWSIFGRIMIYNHLTPSQLFALVATEEARKTKTKYYELTHSSWIDLEKLSNYLNVDPKRLRAAFPDRLGLIIPGQRNTSEYRTRFCVECLKLGFHCSLYDFDILVCCPIHKTVLTHACSLCAHPKRFIGGPRGDGRLFKDCSRCGRAPLPSGMFTLADTPPNQNILRCIEKSCTDLVQWWSLVKSQCEGHEHLLRGIFHSDDFSFSSTVQTRYDFAVSNAEAECPWPLKLSSSQGTTRLRAMPLLSSLRQEKNDSSGSASYRSIRRHLYKRYLRGHRKCLNLITQLDDAELRCIRRATVCPVALAFFMWRESCEVNVCPYPSHQNRPSTDAQEQTEKDAHSFRYRWMEPGGVRIGISSKLFWTYFGFFSIWDAIEKVEEAGSLVCVKSARRQPVDASLDWEMRHDIVESYNAKAPSISLLVPYPPRVNSSVRCPYRHCKADDLVDAQAYSNITYFFWDQDRRITERESIRVYPERQSLRRNRRYIKL